MIKHTIRHLKIAENSEWEVDLPYRLMVGDYVEEELLMSIERAEGREESPIHLDLPIWEDSYVVRYITIKPDRSILALIDMPRQNE